MSENVRAAWRETLLYVKVMNESSGSAWNHHNDGARGHHFVNLPRLRSLDKPPAHALALFS